MTQIVKDEYGRHFYLHNADDAWKVSDNTATMEWGTWEPVFANREPKEEEKEAWSTVTDTDAQLITEAIIQETASFIEEINNLTLSAPNKEREQIYKLIEAVAYAMREYTESYNKQIQ